MRHLDLSLGILATSGYTMALAKCHFTQPSLDTLSHHISRLGLSTTEEKTEAIRILALPRTLKELETGLSFIAYYRSFIPNFASIAEPLYTLRLISFQNAPQKNPKQNTFAAKTILPLTNVTVEKVDLKDLWQKAAIAWEALKTALINATTLAYPDFQKPFILHVDGSKQRGFSAALYQEQDSVKRPILFLSKTLSTAEKNY